MCPWLAGTTARCAAFPAPSCWVIDAQDATIRLAAAKEGSVAGSRAAVGLDDSLWLCPIEDRRGLDSTREGMLQGFSLGSYVQLVDYTGQLFREDKACVQRFHSKKSPSTLGGGDLLCVSTVRCACPCISAFPLELHFVIVGFLFCTKYSFYIKIYKYIKEPDAKNMLRNSG